jgi:hypothetical protein
VIESAHFQRTCRLRGKWRPILQGENDDLFVVLRWMRLFAKHCQNEWMNESTRVCIVKKPRVGRRNGKDFLCYSR